MSGETGKRVRQVGIYVAIVLLVYLSDQISKLLIENNILLGESTPIIKGIVHLTLVHNTGAAFGLFSSFPQIFSGIAVLSVVFIVVFLAAKHSELSPVTRYALCFVLGGTIGNLTDRLRVGFVIDFIDLRIWPVFNLADTCITIGVGMLIISMAIGIIKNNSIQNTHA